MRRILSVALFTSVALFAACRATNVADSDVHSIPSGSGEIPADLDLEGLKSLTVSQWQTLFAAGQASEDLIPSRALNGVVVKGRGFPKIFQVVPVLNDVANQIWNGKNFVTNDGETTLKNQFVQGTGTSQIQLFDAKVVVDGESRVGDGKECILLDYRISGVPGIRAIRDEIRLVRETTYEDAGKKVRRRLFLGPTYMMPEEAPSPASLLVAPWEFQPVLWFALEFTEPVNG